VYIKYVATLHTHNEEHEMNATVLQLANALRTAHIETAANDECAQRALNKLSESLHELAYSYAMASAHDENKTERSAEAQRALDHIMLFVYAL